MRRYRTIEGDSHFRMVQTCARKAFRLSGMRSKEFDLIGDKGNLDEMFARTHRTEIGSSIKWSVLGAGSVRISCRAKMEISEAYEFFVVFVYTVND